MSISANRVLAAVRAGLIEIAVDVRQGTQRDAILFGISANSAHGLPRTNADKRKAVTLLLGDAEWSQWSDWKIAGHCQVSNAFVSRLRRKSASVSGTQIGNRKVERYIAATAPTAIRRTPRAPIPTAKSAAAGAGRRGPHSSPAR